MDRSNDMVSMTVVAMPTLRPSMRILLLPCSGLVWSVTSSSCWVVTRPSLLGISCKQQPAPQGGCAYDDQLAEARSIIWKHRSMHIRSGAAARASCKVRQHLPLLCLQLLASNES